MISIPDDDEKSPSSEQEKNGEEPMEMTQPTNGEAECVKEKEADGEKKSSEEGDDSKSPSEAKTEGSEVKPEDVEVKGERGSPLELNNLQLFCKIKSEIKCSLQCIVCL